MNAPSWAIIFGDVPSWTPRVQKSEEDTTTSKKRYKNTSRTMPNTKPCEISVLVLLLAAVAASGCSVAREAKENAVIYQLLEDGDTALARGQLAAAEESYGRAKILAAKVPHLDLVARALKGVADVRMHQRRYDDAYVSYLEAAATLAEHPGFNPPALAVIFTLAGQAAARTDDPKRALPQFDRAVQLLTGFFGPEHEEIARALHGSGEALIAAGDAKGAKTKLEEARAMRAKLLGEDHPDTRSTAKLLEKISR